MVHVQRVWNTLRLPQLRNTRYYLNMEWVKLTDFGGLTAYSVKVFNFSTIKNKFCVGKLAMAS